ncbi:MAG: heterodisulfide reductase [Deferribacteres bacterium]|nr:heterodisulfide reductase [Deferribacteres bacterium]
MEVKGLLKELMEFPGGEQILKCIQCGTCTGSCPMAYVMDYGPRRLFALAKGGSIRKALMANTYWICASCYFCTVRCPRGIRITDIMYALKRLAVKNGIFPSGEKTPHLYLAFKDTVERYGRLSEAKMMQKFALKDPFGSVKKGALGLKLLMKGRMELKVEPLRNLEAFKRVIDKAKELERAS